MATAQGLRQERNQAQQVACVHTHCRGETGSQLAWDTRPGAAVTSAGTGHPQHCQQGGVEVEAEGGGQHLVQPSHVVKDVTESTNQITLHGEVPAMRQAYCCSCCQSECSSCRLRLTAASALRAPSPADSAQSPCQQSPWIRVQPAATRGLPVCL